MEGFNLHQGLYLKLAHDFGARIAVIAFIYLSCLGIVFMPSSIKFIAIGDVHGDM